MHRVGFILSMNQILKVPERYVNHIVEIGQCLHNISLIVDDICDDTELRRGLPTAHMEYGVSAALLSAYTGLFQILLSVDVHLNNTWVALEECARMHHCNAMEAYARDTYKCLTEDEYMAMVDGKTGSGFRVITRMLVTLAPPHARWLEGLLMELTNDIGRFFQIRDDLMDLVSEEFAKKKGGYGSDFKEGKFSYPVIHCVRTKPETEELFLEVFRKAAADTTEEDVERLTAILREAGSLDFTLDRLHELARDIISGCLVLEANGYNAEPLRHWFSNLAASTDGFTLPAATAADCVYESAKETAVQDNVQATVAAATGPPEMPIPQGMLGMNMMQKLCFSVLELDLTTNLQDIDIIIRQVLACYEIYFANAGLTAKDFWTCFPWFLMWKGGIKATAEKGQSSMIKKLVAASPFADDKFLQMFQKATGYYQSKAKYLEGIQTELSPEEMCYAKPSNFRIMRWLLHKWYSPSSANGSTEYKIALENYMCIINAEQRLSVDVSSRSYNIVLHFRKYYGEEEGNKRLEAFKQQMWDELSKGELQPVAKKWVQVQEECATTKVEDIQIGARDVVKAGFTVARACMEDMELGSSTLQGQSRWVLSHFKPQPVDSMFSDWMAQAMKARK
jgi:geranylgeranyl diphosphate synthase type 3